MGFQFRVRRVHAISQQVLTSFKPRVIIGQPVHIPLGRRHLREMKYKRIHLKRRLIGIREIAQFNSIPKLVLGNILQSLAIQKPLIQRHPGLIDHGQPKLPDLTLTLILTLTGPRTLLLLNLRRLGSAPGKLHLHLRLLTKLDRLRHGPVFEVLRRRRRLVDKQLVRVARALICDVELGDQAVQVDQLEELPHVFVDFELDRGAVEGGGLVERCEQDFGLDGGLFYL